MIYIKPHIQQTQVFQWQLCLLELNKINNVINKINIVFAVITFVLTKILFRV